MIGSELTRRAFVAILLPGLMPLTCSAGCPTTLAYLADSLPRYNQSGLERMRQAVIHENVADDMRRAIATGMTPAQAAAALLKAAETIRARQPDVEACIREVSTNPDRMITELRAGTYQFSQRPGSAVEACASQYVLNYYMVVASKESAIIGACLAREGI